ncbi:pyruvate kinase alpha/beta domain-containing protein [Gehongia tenuis]|uniref:Pyruvate kinase C-terminal domain-containing protein n=1 Tax=Gehongia tenuis TaxID=2763655 RepID=A0A926HQV7_9FIRM|nr:pyruvate kinase alpha/beta domain-containing protein [Gehongia tenuis]MBC8532145.1 hypothetical protein [Gehongia tenuis]
MYFEKAGSMNTEKTLELACQAAKDKNIHHIVVASTTGQTALRFTGMDENIVCVTLVNGFKNKGENMMPSEQRVRLKEMGIKVLTASHALSGVEGGISRKFSGIYPAEMIANTLYMFGQGVKVCVEIAIMALDAGLIPYGEKIVAIAGTGHGADTAMILTPAHAADIFSFKINEIICKPSL